MKIPKIIRQAPHRRQTCVRPENPIDRFIEKIVAITLVLPALLLMIVGLWLNGFKLW